MRLWHKDLIPVLPRLQLLSQWRECCAIARNIRINGTPNHILVNAIMDYPREHFIGYTSMVRTEMLNRGYKVDGGKFIKWMNPWENFLIYPYEIFNRWHNDRYLRQCYYNLEEKYDRGGITEEEWKCIEGLCRPLLN